MREWGRMVGNRIACLLAATTLLAPAVLRADQDAPAPRDLETPGRIMPLTEVDLARVRASPSGTPGAKPRMRVPLASQQSGPSHMHIASGAARVVREPSGAAAVEMEADEEVFVATQADPARRRMQPSERLALPGLVLKGEAKAREGSRAAAGSGGAVVDPEAVPEEGRVWAGRPFIGLAQAVRWNGSEYVAPLLLGLDADAPGSSQAAKLERALTVHVSAPRAFVDPSRVDIPALGPAGYRTVRVRVDPLHATAEQEVEVHTLIGHATFAFRIPRVATSLQLVTDKHEVVGFGIGQATLRARLLAQDGRTHVAEDDLVVDFVVMQGEGDLEPEHAVIPAGASATRPVTFRPSRGGRVKLEARAGDIRSGPVRVDVSFPAWAVAATLLGGALGGFAAFLRRRRAGGLLWRLAEGLVVGVLVAAVSLALPEVVLMASRVVSTTLGLFVTSAAAGFLGTPLLDRLSRRLFPARAKP